MRSAIRALLMSLIVAAGCDTGMKPGPVPAAGTAPAVPPEPGTEIPNPQYAAWAKFKVGTVVVHRTVTKADADPNETVTATTYTLLDPGPEKVLVEAKGSTRRFDGYMTTNPPAKVVYTRMLVLPAGMKADVRPTGVTDEGQEKLSVAGTDYQTTWHKTRDRNEAGEVLTQTWMSPAAPGGLVKSVMRTPAIGKTTTTELVEVRFP